MLKLSRQIIVVALASVLSTLLACAVRKPLAQEDLIAAAMDDARAQVVQVIDDAEREQTVLEIVDQLELDYRTLYDSVQKRRQRIQLLNADYDATREQFEALADQLEANVRQAHSVVRDRRRQLMATTTAEEWSALAKANTRFLRAAVDELQSF